MLMVSFHFECQFKKSTTTVKWTVYIFIVANVQSRYTYARHNEEQGCTKNMKPCFALKLYLKVPKTYLNRIISPYLLSTIKKIGGYSRIHIYNIHTIIRTIYGYKTDTSILEYLDLID